MNIQTLGRKHERGFATLIVMILLVVMSIFLVNNSRVLHQLDQELDLLEAQQLQKFQSEVPTEPERNESTPP